MFRKIILSTAAALSAFTAANTQAGDRFSLGVNLGGGYPVYQPAPVVVNPYPTVYAPNYGYGSGYGSGYGYAAPTYVAPRYVAPSVGFGYSNWDNNRNYGRPYNGYNNFNSGYRGSNSHYGHHHGCR